MNKKFSLGVVVVGIALAIIPLVVGNSSNDVKELSPLYEIRAEQAAKELNGSAIYFADRYNPDESDVSIMIPGVSIGLLSACAGSVCLASGCTGSICLGSACGGSVCIGSACAGSGCASACGGSACGLSGCGGSVCGLSGCAGSVCAGSGCGGSACPGQDC